MSRKHNKSHAEGYVLVAIGIAGAILGYRDRLVFLLGIGLMAGVIIGFLVASHVKARAYYSTMPKQPARAEVPAPRSQHREIARSRRNGWEGPGISKGMILLSPECMGRADCLDCDDKRCQCPCKHDSATILDWNTKHYDEEHKPERDLAEELAKEDEEEAPF